MDTLLHGTKTYEPAFPLMPVRPLMEEAEGDLEDFERHYRGLMDVCDLVRSARLRLIARMKELGASVK